MDERPSPVHALDKHSYKHTYLLPRSPHPPPITWRMGAVRRKFFDLEGEEHGPCSDPVLRSAAREGGTDQWPLIFAVTVLKVRGPSSEHRPAPQRMVNNLQTQRGEGGG